MRIVKALLFAVVGGAVLGALVFFGGFLLAQVLGEEWGQALGMLVPMVATPLAILVGAALGGLKGWRSA